MNIFIGIDGPEEAAADVASQLDEVAEQPTETVRRKNFDGDAATWIVIATLASQAIPQAMEILERILDRRKVKSIKIGDIEIVHPSTEDLKRARQILESKSRSDDQ